MCGRFVALSDPDGLVRFFVVDERKHPALDLNPNVAPTEPVEAVVEHAGRRLLVALRWGLVPRWSGDRRGAARMINARAETVASKPAFREALRRRRCLIPAAGFYEWERRDDGARLPHLLRHRAGEPLAFAGLWETWRDPHDPEGAPLRTCAIVTTRASGAVRALHDRMPVILPRPAWDLWLDRDVRDQERVRDLLVPAAEDLLCAERVPSAVGDPRVKDPALLAPLAGPAADH